jgi:hypothetical protein
MARIEPPKRLAADDLDVTTVTGDDVRRLFDACETLHELVCLSTLAYLGPRRRAASGLRWRDVDLERERIRFREKGGKVITKPIPREYAAILHAARATEGNYDPNGYVIPMVRRQKRAGDRDDRIIYRTVKRLGARAGIEVHTHSLRAAFAVQFLETHPGELEALRRLLGHSKPETTQIYLRRLDRERSMESVQDLSWGVQFGALAEKAPSGFEPLCESRSLRCAADNRVRPDAIRLRSLCRLGPRSAVPAPGAGIAQKGSIWPSTSWCRRASRPSAGTGALALTRTPSVRPNVRAPQRKWLAQAASRPFRRRQPSG